MHAKSHLDEETASCSSSGHVVRIDHDYLTSNAAWLGKMRANVRQKLGLPSPPTGETAIGPHWLVTFTVLTHEHQAPTLKHIGFELYDDGTVRPLPAWTS